MTDPIDGMRPVVPRISREDFITRWDNKTADGVISSAEIRAGGGLQAFAKDLDRLAEEDKQSISLDLTTRNGPSKLYQALRKHRAARFDATPCTNVNNVAQILKPESDKGKLLVRTAMGKLEAAGYNPSQLTPRMVAVDPQGFSHIRLQTPVFGEEVIAHIAPDGTFSFNGAPPSTTEVPNSVYNQHNPRDYAATLSLILSKFGAEPEQVSLKRTLVPQGDQLTTAYEVTVSNFTRHDANPGDRNYKMSFLVSPKDLTILDSWVHISDRDSWSKPQMSTQTAASEGGSSPFTSSFPFAALEKLGPDFYNRMKTQPEFMQMNLVVDGSSSEPCYHIRFANKNGTAAQEYLISQAGEILRRGKRVIIDTPDKIAAPTTSTPNSTPNSTPTLTPVNPTNGTPIFDMASDAKADDQIRHVGRAALQTSKVDDEYALFNKPEFHDGIITMDAKTLPRAWAAEIVTKTDDQWTSADSSVLRSAAAAHFAATKTVEFFRNMGFNSINLQGELIVSNVNIRTNYGNAYWDGQSVNYGEGDGVYLGPLATIDIGAHEITHGFTSRTADLIYSGESGGLNEAFSDIGGFMVEYLASLENPNVTPDWSIGEDTWTPNNGDPTDALRYMNKPTADGMSIDNAQSYVDGIDVHYSSGVGINAFYQLACPTNEGKIPNSVSGIAVQDGIGATRAANIFFRALAYYLTPSATFADARAATIRAAEDLYGKDSKEVAKTKEAWLAVGVPAPEQVS